MIIIYSRMEVLFMEKKISHRFSHIDLMEAIAIFFVILYHCTIYPYDLTLSNHPIVYCNYFFMTILSTCVPLFFFVNGFLLLNRPFNLKKHALKTLHLAFLALFWSLLLLPLILTIRGVSLDFGTFLNSILYLDTAYNMNWSWFLGALVCIYVFFPALKASFDHDLPSFILITIVLAFLTIGFQFGDQILLFLRKLLGRYVGTLEYPFIQMFNPLRHSYGYAFVYFCLGGLFGRFEENIRTIPTKKRNIISYVGIVLSCGMLFLVGIFYTNYVDLQPWDVVWNGYDSIFTLANVIFIYILSLNYTRNFNFIRQISLNTLGIYILHGISINIAQPIVSSYSTLCNVPCNLIYALLILFVTLGICLVIKRIPIIRKMI